MRGTTLVLDILYLALNLICPPKRPFISSISRTSTYIDSLDD